MGGSRAGADPAGECVCPKCGTVAPHDDRMGLGLKFYKHKDGAVFGTFFADPKYEGYSGIIYGGIIATLLDSAMTHCLLMKDVPALHGKIVDQVFYPHSNGNSCEVRSEDC
jgi:hypothetical protein